MLFCLYNFSIQVLQLFTIVQDSINWAKSSQSLATSSSFMSNHQSSGGSLNTSGYQGEGFPSQSMLNIFNSGNPTPVNPVPTSTPSDFKSEFQYSSSGSSGHCASDSFGHGQSWSSAPLVSTRSHLAESGSWPHNVPFHPAHHAATYQTNSYFF